MEGHYQARGYCPGGHIYFFLGGGEGRVYAVSPA